MSYDEADSLADNFGRGLRVLGVKPEDNICLFADTRAEWMISVQVLTKKENLCLCRTETFVSVFAEQLQMRFLSRADWITFFEAFCDSLLVHGR